MKGKGMNFVIACVMVLNEDNNSLTLFFLFLTKDFEISKSYSLCSDIAESTYEKQVTLRNFI